LRFQLRDAEHNAAIAGLRASCSSVDILRFAQTQVVGWPSHREPAIPRFWSGSAGASRRRSWSTGTGEGGTTLLFANALQSVSLVVGVSLFMTNRSRLSTLHSESVALELIDGSSYGPQTIAAVKRTLGERPMDMLFIDGDHAFAGALLDFRSYRGLVPPGGFTGFHDVVPDQRLRGGPPSEAWSGEVPLLWESLRYQCRHREFVESWDQLGAGIGVLEHDPSVEPTIVPGQMQPDLVHLG
jgi:hypothetical protein